MAMAEIGLLCLGSNDIITTNYFPISHGTLNISVAEAKLSRTAMPAGAIMDAAEAKILHPAEDYAIWNSRDVFGTLAEDYGTVLGRAAKWIRTGEDYLSGVVELYERRFVRWWEEEKRREKEEESG
jgi:RNA polymerase I-specific transcription initiation factor RRN7